MKKLAMSMLTVGILGGTALLGNVNVPMTNLSSPGVFVVEARTVSYYILPDSDCRYLSADEVYELSSYEMKLARNEIYARHGRKFKNKKIQAYFDSQAWYDGRISASDFDEDVLNDIESANIEFIQSFE